MPTIRTARPGDEPALYDICLRTGADGDDASALYRDPRLLGSVYVGPYLALEPDLAFVLADGDRVLGYVLGALDTAAFAASCERSWWPALRRQHPLEPELRGPDPLEPLEPLDATVVALLHDPPRVAGAVLADHPSHLHIDLLPQAQGGGAGRLLIDRLLAELGARGSRGVHLGVSSTNTRAIGFYGHLGFTRLSVDLDDDDGDGRGCTMGRRLRRDDGAKASRDVGGSP